VPARHGSGVHVEPRGSRPGKARLLDAGAARLDAPQSFKGEGLASGERDDVQGVGEA
jgi:hypothetical protein